MKTTIILLALAVLTYIGADAQTKHTLVTKTCNCVSTSTKVKAKPGKPPHRHASTATKSGSTSKTGDTYQVCRQVGGHYECCTHSTKGTATTKK